MHLGKWFRSLVLTAVICILTGCSTAHEYKVIDIVDVRQGASYTCGISCAQAILNYYGIHKREDLLAEQFGSTEENGTSPGQLVSGFESYGLTAAIKENSSLDDLKENISKGIPTMVAIQAWLDAYPPSDWSSNWEDGHWVIVTGMDDRNIYFEDPSLLGSRGWMSHEEFLSRWHDYTGGSPCCGPEDKQWIHLSISVQGKIIEYPPATHID